MNRGAVASLLADLRRQEVRFELRDGHVHVAAPKGAISAADRQALERARDEVRRQLEFESTVLGISLDEFAQGGNALQVRVPWLTETLWFVPRLEHVAILARDGVARGRVWTARELADLASIDGLTSDDIRAIGKLKARFGAQIVSVQPSDEAEV